MRLLCSARHPAGCDSLVSVLNHITEKNIGWSITALIDIDILLRFQTKLSICPNNVNTIPVEKLSVDELITFVDQTFQSINPKIVLACSSGPDVSIDEVLIYLAKDRCQSFLIQDFWGDVNLGLGVTADTIFVCDQQALKLTKMKVDSDIVVTGPLKQLCDDQKSLDRPEIRASRDGDLSVLIVGMSTAWSAPGYKANMESIFVALKNIGLSEQVVYRPHPLERRRDLKELKKISATGEINLIWDQDSNVFNSLKKSDLIITAYSSVGFDAILYGSLYSYDVGKVVYWLFDPDL